MQSWDLSFFPMMDNQPYDRFGVPYNITRVLTPEHTFDLEAYTNYSPLYLPASYAITYLIAFALSSAMIVHTLLYHGRTVLHGFMHTRIEKDDIHAKLMRAYPEVPDWWYLLTFVACFALAIITAEVCSPAYVLHPVSQPTPAGVAHRNPCVGADSRHRTSRDVHHPIRICVCHDGTECELLPLLVDVNRMLMVRCRSRSTCWRRSSLV